MGLIREDNVGVPYGSEWSRTSLTSGRLFFVALLFVVAAPLFWQRVELRPSTTPAGHESMDLYQYVYPVYDYGFRRLRLGEVPLWNPEQACGTAFQADTRTALFQPLNVLFLLLPTERALAVHAFVSLCLMGIGFTLFARSLGATYWASLLGALVYTFSGPSAAAMSRPALAGALAWTPFLFWGIGLAARGRGMGGAVLAGLCFAGLLLTGANALILALCLLLIPYAVLIVLSPWPEGNHALPRRAVTPLLAAGLGMAVSAVHWGPALAWLVDAGRFDPSFWNMHETAELPAGPGALILQFVSAKAGTLPRLAYYGIAALVLMPMALFHGRLRRYAAFFAGSALVSFLAVLLAPAVSGSGFPLEAFGYTALFSIAALTTLGADRLFSLRRTWARRSLWLTVGTVLTAAVLLFVLFPPRGQVLAVVLAVVPILALRRGWGAVLSGSVLAILLFVDLMAASVNVFTHPFEDAPAYYRRYSNGIAVSQEEALGSRTVISSDPLNIRLPNNLGLLSGVRAVGGFQLPETEVQAAWRQRAWGSDAEEVEPAYNLLNFASARVLMVAPGGPMPQEPPSGQGLLLREIPADGDVRIYINERALPRAYWVPACRLVDDVDLALKILADPSFDSDRTCVIDRSAPGFEPDANGLPSMPMASAPTVGWRDATCNVEDPTAEQVRIAVDAPQRGLVVLSDTFASGWEATLDGVPCHILRANGTFRAISVPQGRHEIVFSYRPMSFRVCSAISLATVALIGALGVVTLFHPRPAEP